MINEKFLQLVKVLLEGTHAGKIKWHETVDENAFRVVFGSGLVRIESVVRPEDESTFYLVSLQNRQGRTVDEFVSEGGLVSAQLLSELYYAARASARSADKVLDSILRDAEAGKTVEPPKDYLRRE